MKQPPSDASVVRLPLERPASIRRLLPDADDNSWISPDYLVGPENEQLRFLFDESNYVRLDQLSPVVMFGERESGKTALAVTLAVRWSRALGRKKLYYTTGSSLASDFAYAVEIDDVDSFRSRIRKCNLLIVDSADAIRKKKAAQDELVHAIDHLSARSVPSIFIFSQIPSALPGLKASLVSRLSSGFSLAIARPGEAARLHLVSSLLLASKSSLDAAVVDEICALCGTNLSAPQVRSIVQIALQNLLPDGSIDRSVVVKVARQTLDGQELSMPAIAKIVARVMRVKFTELRGSSRESAIVRARGIAIVLARRLTSLSLQAIGEYFGGRDHSTILHAYRKTSKALDSDNQLAKQFTEVQNLLLK